MYFEIKEKKMKDYKKYFKIEAEVEDIYTALTNPITIELWSGYPAVMSTEPDSEFSLWDGDITGKNLEFIPNKLIKQAWDFDEQTEPSIVTIKLHPDKNFVSVEVRHTNIPDEAFENIVQGWEEFYMGTIREFYENE